MLREKDKERTIMKKVLKDINKFGYWKRKYSRRKENNILYNLHMNVHSYAPKFFEPQKVIKRNKIYCKQQCKQRNIEYKNKLLSQQNRIRQERLQTKLQFEQEQNEDEDWYFEF